ncbi:MAG TPA: TlpA disulfide reductase family protein [Rhizomicrobium sp.]|nr:TlpA disulfide reductase family protein [Rhizomicrobium sp.]
MLRRHLFAILAVVAAAAAGGALYVIHARPVHAGDATPAALAKLVPDAKPKIIPAVAFTNAKGERLSLASFHGHYLLLNLWATWCAPCVRELPALAHLQSALPGLIIVAVSEGQESVPDTAAFLKAHGAGGLAVYRDPDHAFLAAMGAFGLPLSALIDESGRERARAIGPAQWDDPQAIAWLRVFIASPNRHPAS